MRRAEKILIVLILLGLVMCTFSLPFGTVLFILSTSTLSLLYAYLGFALFNGVGFKGIFKKGSFKGVGAWGILLAIFTGLVLSVSVVGVQFRLLHWPSAKVLLGGGLIGLGLTLILAFVARSKGKTLISKRIFQRVIPFLAVALIFFFLSSDTIRHFKFRLGENGIEKVDPERIDRHHEEMQEGAEPFEK